MSEHYDHVIATAACPQCGQGQIAAGADAVCSRCRAGQYGGTETHESAKLFEPAPTQLRGQLGMGS